MIKFKHNLNQSLTSSHPSISSLSISHDKPGTMGNWHNPETSFVPFQRNMEVWPCTLKGITSKNCKKGQSKTSLCRDLKKRHAGDKTTFAPSARKNIMLAIQVTWYHSVENGELLQNTGHSYKTPFPHCPVQKLSETLHVDLSLKQPTWFTLYSPYSRYELLRWQRALLNAKKTMPAGDSTDQ